MQCINHRGVTSDRRPFAQPSLRHLDFSFLRGAADPAAARIAVRTLPWICYSPATPPCLSAAAATATVRLRSGAPFRSRQHHEYAALHESNTGWVKQEERRTREVSNERGSELSRAHSAVRSLPPCRSCVLRAAFRSTATTPRHVGSPPLPLSSLISRLFSAVWGVFLRCYAIMFAFARGMIHPHVRALARAHCVLRCLALCYRHHVGPPALPPLLLLLGVGFRGSPGRVGSLLAMLCDRVRLRDRHDLPAGAGAGWQGGNVPHSGQRTA